MLIQVMRKTNNLDDLNLLIAFDALIGTLSVTQAAVILNISQPAMSRVLAKLRKAFDDQLFVRVGNRMEATPRATALAPIIQSSLVAFNQAMASIEPFDPLNTTREFAMATADYAQVTSLARGIKLMRQRAPRATLTVTPLTANSADQLHEGSVDLLIGPSIELSWARSKHLFDESWQCLASRDHHVDDKRWTLKRYLQCKHALVSPDGIGIGPVDAALSNLGEKRQVVLKLPDFSGALWVTAKSDLILTVPTSLAHSAVRMFPLFSFAPPVKLPTAQVYMAWHDRMSGDAAHQWFREMIAASIVST